MVKHFCDVLLVSKSKAIEERAQSVCSEFAYSFKQKTNFDDIFEQNEIAQPKVLLVDLTKIKAKESAGGEMQVARQIFNDAFILGIVEKTLDANAANYIKKCGGDVILLENEVFDTSKLEFILSQVIKASFFPIKSHDIKNNSTINFNVYHFLALRGKFLPCLRSGETITEERLNKVQEVGELFIHRNDIEIFKKYTEKNSDASAKGLVQRCRAQYLSLYFNYSQLVFTLTDQSERASFQKGQKLLAECKKLGEELGYSLASLGNAWDIVNNSTIGEFGSLERAPAVAAYAAILALNIESKDFVNIIVGALLSDLGLIFLPPRSTRLIREDAVIIMNDEELTDYRNHPIKSLNIALSRKLPIEDTLRNIILNTHETVDGEGFPSQAQKLKIPASAQIVHIASILDSKTTIKNGKERTSPLEVARDFLQEQMGLGKFSFELVSKLLKTFGP